MPLPPFALVRGCGLADYSSSSGVQLASASRPFFVARSLAFQDLDHRDYTCVIRRKQGAVLNNSTSLHITHFTHCR
jgi:hypothetical protein